MMNENDTMAKDDMVKDDTEKKESLSILEGTVVAISEDEVLFVAQLNLCEALLERTAEDWFASEQMPYMYRLTGIGSDISVGSEIRISFAVATRSIPPLVPVVDDEIIENLIPKDIFSVLEGTVVAVLEDEVLFVAQLNLSEALLERTAEDWFASDELSDLYRLTNIGSDISVGSEIRISFAIMTLSIPPLVPVINYEIIENDIAVNEAGLRVLEGTVIAILGEEFLFVKQLNLCEALLKRTLDEWFKSDESTDLYRLTNNGSDLSVGSEIRISFAIATMSIPPLIPSWDYEII